MGITPHQSASNVVTQQRNARKASMVRRGIAAEFEHDFVTTATGRTRFMASLAQMARRYVCVCILEQICINVLI
jgi:hypothetical protein